LQASHIRGEAASQRVQRDVDNTDIKQDNDKAQACGSEDAALIAAHGRTHIDKPSRQE
jgi:hypothetical protein